MKEKISTKLFYCKDKPKLAGIVKITGDADSKDFLMLTHLINLDGNKIVSLPEYSKSGGNYYRKINVLCFDDFFVLDTKSYDYDDYKVNSYKAYKYTGDIIFSNPNKGWKKSDFDHIQEKITAGESNNGN